MNVPVLLQAVATATFVAGAVFTAVQILLARRAREREVAVEILRLLNSPQFAKALRLMYDLEPGLSREAITRWILHPGGRRIIEVMSERLGLREEDLAPTEAVLSEHGNMSSVTVLFVLDEILRGTRRPRAGERGVMGAFGPGFGAEFALIEFT